MTEAIRFVCQYQDECSLAAVGSEACALCRLKSSFLRSINRSGDFQVAFRVLMRDLFYLWVQAQGWDH
jgi:hypothetical protein